MTRHTILRVLAKLLIPFILLFALYVQFHGDFGPGGGFQAGVIFGAGFILYALIFGLPELERVFPARLLEMCVALGVFLYGAVGVATIILGHNFLGYGAFARDPRQGQHLGILLVELGVGTTVAAVMITLFVFFARRKRS